MGTGHTPSRSHPEYWEDCTIPWLTLADVHQLRDGTRTVVHDTSEKVSLEGIRNSSAVPHPAGTVAMSRTASVGFTCIMGTTMATSQDFVTWTCTDRLDNRFLLWALRGERAQILSRMQGSTHKTIYMPDLEDLQISLPPLAEQRAVADYLDTETALIDALIAKKRQLIHLLEERLDALIDSHFSPDGSEPTVRLARLATVQTGVTLNAAKVNSGATVRLPYLRVANVQPGWLDLYEVKEVEVDLAAAARSMLQPGDVLMTEGGDIDKLGRGTVWRDEIENCLHQNHVFAVRPHPKKLDSDFLANVTRTSHARAYFESTGVQSTNLASTNSFKVADFRIGALDIDQQRARCDSYDRSARTLTEASSKLGRQLGLLAEHRQALITAAVTGEFAVPGAA